MSQGEYISPDYFRENSQKYETEKIVVAPYGNPGFDWSAANTAVEMEHAMIVGRGHPKFEELKSLCTSTRAQQLTLRRDGDKALIQNSSDRVLGSLDISNDQQNDLGTWAARELEKNRMVSYDYARLSGQFVEMQIGVSDQSGKFDVYPLPVQVISRRKLEKMRKELHEELGREGLEIPDRVHILIDYNDDEYLADLAKLGPASSFAFKREESPGRGASRGEDPRARSRSISSSNEERGSGHRDPRSTSLALRLPPQPRLSEEGRGSR